jgi:hypothetical protein
MADNKKRININPRPLSERQIQYFARKYASAKGIDKSKIPKIVESFKIANRTLSSVSVATKAAIVESSLLGLQLSEVEELEKLFDINVSGSGVTIKSNFALFSQQLQNQLNEIQSLFLENMLESIKNKTPVRTGAAQAGWEIVNNKIVNPVPYVKYLEFGTERMRPVAMMASTVAQSQDLLNRAISNSTPIKL